MRKKIGFALGGGGAKGAAHVGFLSVMEENGIFPDMISGTSVGAVVGGVYAAGGTVAQMLEIIDTLKMSDIVDFDPLFFRRLGLVRGKKFENFLKANLSEELTFDKLKIPFGCVAVDLKSGTIQNLREGLVWQCIAASAAIPSGFQPIEINGMLLVDGGALDRVPSELCREMGADIVIGVDIVAKLVDEYVPTNIVDQLTRVYDIIEWHITCLKKAKADIMLEIEQPDVEKLRVKNLRSSYEHGRRVALENLDEIKKLIGKE